MAPESKREPIGLVGAGLFGTARAERLLTCGYPVSVHNRTREKADPLLARGATWSDNPLNECRRTIFCLFTTEQVAQGYTEEKMEVGTTGTSVLGASSSEQGGVTLDTMVQRLIQKTVWEIDSKYK